MILNTSLAKSHQPSNNASGANLDELCLELSCLGYTSRHTRHHKSALVETTTAISHTVHLQWIYISGVVGAVSFNWGLHISAVSNHGKPPGLQSGLNSR